MKKHFKSAEYDSSIEMATRLRSRSRALANSVYKYTELLDLGLTSGSPTCDYYFSMAADYDLQIQEELIEIKRVYNELSKLCGLHVRDIGNAGQSDYDTY